jgi:hypothetical protein
MVAAAPLIVLGPGRSYTTLVSAMLGQHPQMFSFPETHLLVTDTLRDWWGRFGTNFQAHGLLRAVAHLIFRTQNERTVETAREWLLRRLRRPSAEVFCELGAQVVPRKPVDKSPLMVRDLESMIRVFELFPEAHFLHVTRHPLRHGLSMMKMLNDITSHCNPGAPLMSSVLLSPISLFAGMTDRSSGTPILDPQIQWYNQHSAILAFLAGVPPPHRTWIRGEDLVADPDSVLRRLTSRLQLRSDRSAIDSMKHPEKWPFAGSGPANAPGGGDPKFLHKPALRAAKQRPDTLEGPLPWRPDGKGFTREVRELAERFGYN